VTYRVQRHTHLAEVKNKARKEKRLKIKGKKIEGMQHNRNVAKTKSNKFVY